MHDHDEHEDGRRLLAPLVGEPSRPSTVDIRRAVADGRRRLRTRRWAGVGAVAAVTALAAAGVPAAFDLAGGTADVPSAPAATPASTPAELMPSVPPGLTACEVERLPVPDDAYQSLVTGGDPTGRYLLGRSYSRGASGETAVRVLIWDDGEPVPVDLAGSDGSLNDINSRGEAVGISYVSDIAVSWLYRDGALTRLPDGYQAYAITEQGAIAGSRAGAEEFQDIPLVWRSPTAAPEDLSVPGETWSVVARDVDADGTVVGSGYDRDDIPRPPVASFVWSADGTRQRLPLPSSEVGTIRGFAASSIRDGIVVGRAEQDLGGGTTAFPIFQYDLATGEFTPLSADDEGGASAWSAAGWLVIWAGDGLALWHADVGTIPLPELPGIVDDGDVGGTVVVISDDGRVVGGQLPSGRTVEGDGGPYGVVDAVVWHCR